ncbi:hypothetical protein IGS59_22920 [Janthinobacterium sp. GW460P]|uniref:hypothetical protein n=1 Tax=unclassified Janthinobacterium TaxID=2610881 RepID=UPI00111C25E1|nr:MULTISPECIES: hypothetical protein [unclassified Janthinobacterium]MCC7705100.1 hypothetical protein [Janthinobacterium sp. GW460P]MCC7710602.1 hypothetical protein [Janthinobacterium sp. GW460W]
MTGSGKRRADGPCPVVARAVPATTREKQRGSGERRFADGVKTMVSGVAVFALSMSVCTSLIRGNLLRRLSTTSRRSHKNIFPFVKNKVPQTSPNKHAKSLKNPSNQKMDKT